MYQSDIMIYQVKTTQIQPTAECVHPCMYTLPTKTAKTQK